MKKASTFIFALVLSALIVYLGGGAVVVRCLNSGAVSLGQLPPEHTAEESMSCMQVSVEKLSPVPTAEEVNLPAPTFTCCEPTVGLELTATSLLVKEIPNTEFLPPPAEVPRLYLQKITVLQI